MKTIFIFLVLFTQPLFAAGLDASLIEKFKTRFQLVHPLQKRVDNRGNGDKDLYGVRNFRLVLNGLLYRGGANNLYHNSKKRSNDNPLPEDGLYNLCKQGFGKAIYLYNSNYETASKTKSCQTYGGANNTLEYLQMNPFTEEGLSEIHKVVHNEITSEFKGPIYSHCWNGWHASGLVAATSLRQFCGMSADEAVQYWDLATDGVNKEPTYEKVRQKIRNFKPSAELQISQEIREKICPSGEEMRLAMNAKGEKIKEARPASKLMGVKL